jgi:leucyl aminopeptidase (aminopeptidase T)
MHDKNSLLSAARKLLKHNIKLKRRERVALVTDRTNCPIFRALKSVLDDANVHYTEVHLDPKRSNSAPIPGAKDILIHSDVIIAPTTKSISHSPETRLARKKYGARVASMPGITQELFIKAMKADSSKIKKVHERLHRLLRNAKSIYVISPSGTDITIDVSGRRFKFDDAGDISRKGVLNNVPFGEVCTFMDKGDGIIAIDSWGKNITKRMSAKLCVKNGRIASWNQAADIYVKNQMKAGPCGLLIVELGLGTNPAHKMPIGIVLHDEKIYGSAHIAFGGGGGIRKCPVHEDVIILKPTVSVDGKTLIKAGKFAI